MSDSVRKIKDFLILGKYLKPTSNINEIRFAQNAFRLREHIQKSYEHVLGATAPSSEYLLKTSIKETNKITIPSQSLIEHLKKESVRNLIDSWKEKPNAQPLSFIDVPSSLDTDEEDFDVDLSVDKNVDNFSFTSYTFLSSFNGRWNFSFQDFLRSRRQFWKRLFFDPGSNLSVFEHDPNGTTPSAKIASKWSENDFSFNLTLESIRLVDKSDLPDCVDPDRVRMVKTESNLNAGTASILLTSVRKRLFLNSTRLGTIANSIEEKLMCKIS